MIHLSRFWTIAIVSAAATLSATPAYCGIKAGVGEAVITPPVGTALYGFTRFGVSDGVHDELYARTLVIEGENGIPAALMTLDLEWIAKPTSDAIREGVSKQTGIPVPNIILNVTHTHSGPDVKGLNDPYTQKLVERSIESAVTAWKNRVPGRIGFGTSEARELGRNDRTLLYGGAHPDPEVAIIKIEDANGKLLGVAFNYGCHPTVLDKFNLKITEDWPYYAITGIKEKAGKNVWVAYYQSAQGNIKVGFSAELSAVGANMGIRTFEYANYKGNMMVDAVMKVLPSIKTSEHPDVAVAGRMVEFPARQGYRLTVEEAQQQADSAKAAMDYAANHPERYGVRMIDSFKMENFLAGLRLYAAKTFNAPNRPQNITLLQQAVRIGDTVFVTFPCEVFAEIGLAVKTQSPCEKTFVLGLAGSLDEYLTTAEEFREEGYEGITSPFAPEAEQVLVKSSLDLIGEVTKPAK